VVLRTKPPIFPLPNLRTILDGERKISLIPSFLPKNAKHLVSKEPVIVILSRHISFLEWFAKFHP
jgi:hypothetical protein